MFGTESLEEEEEEEEPEEAFPNVNFYCWTDLLMIHIIEFFQITAN